MYWDRIDKLALYGGVAKKEQEEYKHVQEQSIYLNTLRTYDLVNNVWQVHPVTNGEKVSAHRSFVLRGRFFCYGGTDG